MSRPPVDRLASLGLAALDSPALRLIGALAIPLGGLALGLGHALRRSLPELSGVRRLPGLRGEVEVSRDRWGVPHLEAASLGDLFFGQGYVHAQDRLFQMEISRRLARGTLAELVGERGLDADRFFRRVGVARAAVGDVAALEGEAREMVESYVSGVNAYLGEHAGRFPPEFALLRHTPEPWSVLDVLAWTKFIGWALSLNWDTELLRARLLDRLGPEGLAEIEPGYPADHPISVDPETVDPEVRAAFATAFSQPEYEAARRYLDALVGRSLSNAWAVAGSRSSTGKPLLANDPHLDPRLPAFWYECHLRGGDLDVAGVSVAGTPGVVVGHNQRVAWGITMSLADVQDLYLERLNPANPREYEFAGRWEEGEVFREEIRVRGRQSVVEEVLVTRHGPVIWPSFGKGAGGKGASGEGAGGEVSCLSVRASALDPTDSAAILALDRAGNWSEFRAALGRWPVSSLSFVYADVEGNIGYALGGKIPIRSGGVGLAPVPGWSGEHEWRGYITAEELPAVLNPPAGLVVSANNQIVGDEYPYLISREWSDGYRAARIRELLDGSPRHSTASFAEFQMDQLSLAAVELKPYLLAIPPEDPYAARALALVENWDCRVTAESAAAAVYEVFRHCLLVNVFGPKLGDLLQGYLGVGHGPLFTYHVYHTRVTSQLLRLLGERPVGWFSDGAKAAEREEPPLAVSIGGQRVELPSPQPSPRGRGGKAERTISHSGRGGEAVAAGSAGLPLAAAHPSPRMQPDPRMKGSTPRWPRDWDEALRMSLREAVRYLRAAVGDEAEAWRWGDLHKLSFEHPIGVGPLGVMNRGPYSSGGDHETVCQAASDPATPYLANGPSASYRQVVDLADWDRGFAVLPSGQSGHPASPHYHDQFELWRNGKLHPWPFSRQAVRRATVHRLVLRPRLP